MQINMDIHKVNASDVSERRLDQSRKADNDKNADDSADKVADRQDRVGPSDEVQLSERAQSLRATADAPVFDQSRVESIRAAIAEGRYHMDPDRLAERFLELENQLG